MTNQNRNDDAEIIDVAYQTATEHELFSQVQTKSQSQPPIQDENEEALVELALEVMRDPERCFCRNCGQAIYKNASVCVHCHYVVNPIALQQGQQLVHKLCLRRSLHHVYGIPVEIAHILAASGAEVATAQDFKDAVAHVGQAQIGDSIDLLGCEI